MSSDTTTPVVTPSQSHEVNDLTQRTHNFASSKTKKKTTLPNIIIHIDPLKHTSTGELAINSIVDILDKQGYDNCFGHKKKGQFFAILISNYMLLMDRFRTLRRQKIWLSKRKSWK